MEYKSLQRIRNRYPTGADNVNDTFSIPDPPPITINQAYSYPSENTVTFRGKYPQNVVNFEIQSLQDVKESTITEADGSPLTFQFVVNFPNADGTPDYWTSPSFKSKLRTAQLESNPYFRLDNVPIINVNFVGLQNYSKSEKLIVKEGYAGVEVLDTINTKEDMLLHINWMVSSDENLRPVLGNQKYNPLGVWQVLPDTTYNQQWADFLDQLETTDIPDNSPIEDASDPLAGLGETTTIIGIDGSEITIGLKGGEGIITPLGGDPLDPLNLNGTQTNDVDYNIFDAFTNNTTITLSDGTSIPINTGGNSSNTQNNTPISIGPIDIGPLNISVGGVNTNLNLGGIGGASTGIWFGETVGSGIGISPPINIVGQSSTTSGTYFPFTSAGSYVGEVRLSNGISYTWGGKRWRRN